MKRTTEKKPNIKDIQKNEKKNISQDVDSQDFLLKLIAEIIVEIIIKETTHGSDRVHPKKH